MLWIAMFMVVLFIVSLIYLGMKDMDKYDPSEHPMVKMYTRMFNDSVNKDTKNENSNNEEK